MNYPTIKQRVMYMAHEIFKSGAAGTWSEALQYAWQLHYFRKMLQAGIVWFSYLKINDVILTRVVRPARGTLNLELIPKEFHPVERLDTQSAMRTPNYSVISYFDLDVMGWRSFKLPLLHSIDRYVILNDVPINEE